MSAAGYLGRRSFSLVAKGHKLLVCHGSLYEPFVHNLLEGSAGLNVEEDLANWALDWLLEMMEQEFEVAEAIIVCSPLAKTTFPELFESKCIVVPLGSPDWAVKSNVIQAEETEELGRLGRTFLHVSSLVPQKNVDRILDAFLSIKGDEDVLVVCGPSPSDKILYHRLKSESGVVYMGRQTRSALRYIYHSADAFVHPSLADGWAMAVTEALGSGLPVLSSYQTGAASFYYERSSSQLGSAQIWLADPLSKDDIAREWSNMAKSIERKQRTVSLVSWGESADMLSSVISNV